MKADLEFYEALMFFSSGEFEYPEEMDLDFLVRLDTARCYADVPFEITSDYRETSTGAHSEGKGVDIRVKETMKRYSILRGLILAGFNRIGIYDKHIHADTSVRLNQDVVWLGKSK